MDNMEYHAMLRRAYEETGDVSALEKYVVSETLPPIEDYDHAVQMIRENYRNAVSCRLLMIGAHIVSTWCFDSEQNDFLNVLNEMYPFFPAAEKGIVSFLNAHHIRSRDLEHYRKHPEYEALLLRSITENEACVMSRVYLAEFYSRCAKGKARKMRNAAASHTIKVYSMEELAQMTGESLASAEAYINEHILGTHISCVNYELRFGAPQNRAK